MKRLQLLIIVLNMAAQFGFVTNATAQADKAITNQKDWMVRIAKIEIDPAYLKEYRAAVEEHTQAAVKLEPGVLSLLAVYEKEHPARVTILEIYASKEAYQLHLKSAHFLKYKTSTLHMVKSLELIDVDPIALGAKSGLFEF